MLFFWGVCFFGCLFLIDNLLGRAPASQGRCITGFASLGASHASPLHAPHAKNIHIEPQTDILEADTGIAIVSIGETRILKFRNIESPDQYLIYKLTAGSLVYMTQEIQKIWQHSIPKSDTEKGRISLTFRQMR